MNKITPQQAFEAAQVLWPKAESIRNDVYRISVYNGKAWHECGDAEVEWPEGTDRWPMPEPEPQWRNATINDFVSERNAKFSDDLKRWRNGKIKGFNRIWNERWQDDCGEWWQHCQVLDNTPETSKSTLTFGGRTIEIVADPTLEKGEWFIAPSQPVEITSQAMLEEALAKGSPVQCGIDWAKAGNCRTVTEQRTIPCIGGPNDGRFVLRRNGRIGFSVPVFDENQGSMVSQDTKRRRYQKFVYSLRTIDGIDVYAPEGMIDQDILIRLFENYHPPKRQT